MKTYRYELVTKKPSSKGSADAAPLWWPRRLGLQGLVEGNVDPWLTQIGDVAPTAIDFVRISTAVLTADRLSPRGGGWTRTIRLHVPVLDPRPWGEALPSLGELLLFVSGDDWTLELTPKHLPRRESRRRQRTSLRSRFSVGGWIHSVRLPSESSMATTLHTFPTGMETPSSLLPRSAPRIGLPEFDTISRRFR